MYWKCNLYFYFDSSPICLHGEGGVYDLYCSQPPGGDQRARSFTFHEVWDTPVLQSLWRNCGGWVSRLFSKRYRGTLMTHVTVTSAPVQVGTNFLTGMHCFKSAADRFSWHCMKSNTPSVYLQQLQQVISNGGGGPQLLTQGCVYANRAESVTNGRDLFPSVTWTERESETAHSERLFMIYWFYKKMSWWIFNIISWLFSLRPHNCSNSL